jgi:hypothetical protein
VDSILPEKPSKRTEDRRPFLARAVSGEAFRLRLPWKVRQLYVAGKQAEVAARRDWSHSRLGLPLEGFLKLRAEQAIKETGKTLQAQAAADSKKRPPSEQEIETALKAFDAKQWGILIKGLGRVEVEALGSYVKPREEILGQQLGERKVIAVVDFDREFVSRCQGQF